MREATLIIAIVILPALSYAQQRPDAVARTTVCDLLRAPDKYTARIVDLDALIAWSEEGTVLFGKGCQGSILFDVGDPHIETRPGSGKQYRRLMRLAKKTYVAARVTGTFEHSTERTWGHLAAFDSRLLTTSVSDVRAVRLKK
jgi:hypothetical protein